MATKTAIRKVMEKWQKRNMAAANANKWSKRKGDLDKEIIDWMQRNGLKSIQSEETGDTITLVEPQPVVYDPEKLVAELKKTEKGRAVLKRVQVTTIDMKAVAAEVQAGNITSKMVSKASSIKTVAPHLAGGKLK